MKNWFKEIVMGLLVWCCIIWFCAFDPEQIGHWFKIACYIGGITWFWWWICDFDNPFVSENEEDEVA